MVKQTYYQRIKNRLKSPLKFILVNIGPRQAGKTTLIKQLFKPVFYSGLLAALLWQCANPVSPTGGPKDITPPQVVKSDPPNFSNHFDKKKITITFDEFVTLKDANQQIIISPPLSEKPDFKLRGKSFVINLNSELKSNTTYTFFFGNAIVDLTENNPLAHYLYVLSTGDHIDSLSIGGKVVSAFDLQPRDGIFVMLYEPGNDTVPPDSLPYLVRPTYVAKTDAEGNFNLRNLRDEMYKIFALNDLDNNYLYNLPNEEIAFIDSLLKPRATASPSPSDTTAADTLTGELPDKDTITGNESRKDFFQLRMFTEIDSTQRLSDVKTFKPAGFLIIFKFPALHPQYRVVNKEVGENWCMEELNARRDSLMVWVKDRQLDSLQLQVADGDSILDTVMLVINPPEKSTRRRNQPKTKKPKPEKLKFKTNTLGSVMDLRQHLVLTFANPLKNYDFKNATFITGEDTLTGAPFEPADTLHRRFKLNHQLEEHTKYEILIPDSALFDIYGITNDSIRISFTTKQLSDYGNIFIDIECRSDDHYYIIQLLRSETEIVRSQYIHGSAEVSFELVPPGKYRIKAILDSRRNKRWDTGDYPKKIQPENVYYFPAEINIRANWDISESLTLP
jgi:hypothetical protein